MDLKSYIRHVPDFPKPGILFYAGAWRETVRRMAEKVAVHRPEVLIGIESRGFLVAAPLALELGIGFAMVRKKGKLPGDVITHHYDLEYGSDTIEIQANAVRPGQRVVLLDDLLATGGTASAAISLLRRVGADVTAAGFIIELTFLAGRDRLGVPAETLLAYDD
jgi:adenine phosphoribosyltransferase